jgi:hypothetical protein
MDKLIETYLKHKNSDSVKYEFELRFKHYLDPLTRSDYNNVIEWLLLSGFKIKERVSLFRISMGKHIRAEIDGIENIKKYCNQPTSEMLKYVEKQQITEPFTHAGYNVQFSLNSETVKPTVESMSENNTFRFMKRIQLHHPDHPHFVIDCSIVKMLRNSPNKSMNQVFNMQPSYEIEAEFIEQPSAKEFKNVIQFVVKSVLKGLQRTNFPISYTEIATIQEEYKQLFPSGEKYFNFIGPNTVTLQHSNMPMLNEEDFMVTDKADGERKLLFISKSMKMYLIPTSGHVENMNCTLQPQKGLPIGPIVLDGEHVVRDTKNQYHNTFYAFDIYSLNIEPMTEQNKSNIGIDKNDVRSYSLPIRREVLIRVVNTVFASITNLVENKYAIQYKRFLSFSPANCRLLYETPTPYHKDGLIFTPVKYGVGLTEEDKPISNKRITWDLNLKWKPPEENTIDFYVDIDPTVKKTVTGKEYKTITLKSSYSAYPSRMQSDYTVCPSVSVYQNLDVISNGKKRIPFIGGRPYDVSAYVCNCFTNEEGNICTNTEGHPVEVLEHGSIVEFKYDGTKEKGWRWTPIRVRWDKTDPNAYSTAVKNWISIHNPVTYMMLVAPHREEMALESLRPVDLNDEYYTLKPDKGTMKEGKLMSDFHNDIKRMLLVQLSEKVRSTHKKNPMLIDFASGKGGDIQKWEEAKYGFVLGIDINNDNLHNEVDGAFMRVIQRKMRKMQKREQDMIPMLFVEGSSSLLIKRGDSIKHDYENRIVQYLFGMESTYPPMLSEQTRIPYGICKQGFDIGSIQFALHYMFDSETSVLNFVTNLMDCIQVGGYFCATCFDGDSMLELLKDIKKDEIMSTCHDEEGTFKLSTTITKLGPDGKPYVPFSSIQKQYNNTDLKVRIDPTQFINLPIGVKQQSLNKEKFLVEYLVFADYFIHVMKKHGFELATHIRDFPNGTGLFKSVDSKYKDMSKDPNQQAISFLNRYYIFQKTKNILFRANKVIENEKKIKVIIN